MSKKLIHYKYEMDIFWSEEDEAYVVNVPELVGCITHGETIEEAVEMAKEAIEGYLETLKKMGKPIPVPLAEKKFSGKIPLRIDPILHRSIAQQATMERKSVNSFIEEKLKKVI